MRLSFTAYGKPEPQGSAKGFLIGGKVRITSANPKMRPFRSSVTAEARYTVAQENLPEPVFPKHEPVRLVVTFTFLKPPSVPRRREHCVVKPDLDKLTRLVNDALTGVAYADDAQVVETVSRKVYGPIEGVTVTVERV